MTHLWVIAGKELRQNRRDPLALLFTIVLPVIFSVFLGLLIPSYDEESNRLPLAVADADGGPAAQKLTDKLSQAPMVEVHPASVSEVDSAVQDRKVAAGLIIPKGYSEAVESDRPTALTFVGVETSTGASSVRQAVATVLAELNTTALAARAAARQAFLEAGGLANGDADAELLQRARSLVDAQLATPAVAVKSTPIGDSAAIHAGGFQQSSPGSLVNWVLFSLLGVCATTTWERRCGLLRRLSAAGIRTRHLLGGKMLAMITLSFLQQLLLILLGQLAFGVDYFGSPAALLVVMISLSLLAAAFGLLIASVLRSEQAVVAATVITALLLASLGGGWFPLDITSAGFARAAHILPSTWIMDALHGITLKSWGLADILQPMGVVWVWIVAVFGIAVWRFRPD